MMRLGTLGLGGAVALAAWGGLTGTAPGRSQPVAASGCKALDGDTLRCDRTRRVRLLGVDAAELPGHCAQGRDCAPGDPFAQKAALQAFLDPGGITIEVIKLDRYGRAVSIVTNAAGANASCAAIQAGARYVEKWDDHDRIGLACSISALKAALRARQGGGGG